MSCNSIPDSNNLTSGTQVAIKKISVNEFMVSKGITEEKLIEEFKSEALVMKNLPAHPNIVIMSCNIVFNMIQVLFLGITLPPQPLCMLLEYCAGGSLKSLLDSNRTISDSTMISMALDIARGVVS